MTNYLLDTNVVVDYLRGDKKALALLENVKTPQISAASVGEIYHGVRDDKALRNVKQILTRFNILHFTESISQRAIKLVERFFLSNGLLLFDALIAATAIDNNMTLLTSNIKHFKMIKELKLEKW